MDSLRTTIARIASNLALLRSSEEATRQGAILPVLAALGWQWHNLDEVIPEYSAGKGRVDYCLRDRGESLVFLEVKKAGTELHAHQQQLLRYAFEKGIGLAVLTDGLVWWLYLPTAEGSWEQRRFFSLDIRRVPHERSADVLHGFLARSAVLSGDALARARSEFEGQEKQRRIREALPVAWKQLTEGPDELLSDLLAEAVAGIAGHTPDSELIADFLVRVEPPTIIAGETPPGRRRSRRSSPRRTGVEDSGSQTGRASYTGKTPTAVVLGETAHPVSSWRDVLTTVCEVTAASDRTLVERMLSLRGRKRAYFSRVPDELRKPLPVGGAALFVEGNLSANDIVRLCEAVLSAMPGARLGFSVQVDESAPMRRRPRPQ